ncbi:sphingosine 1-phosphate receptor 2-like [Anneissia japonica]|uniref:sphingosine 1-phosphate receptor 2-like n=1 Tax=Anneissia japonica TaxID=1529436 RepID=UPI0014256691|nr:sphingosine 1-phosphate receptor 2-like [Anneissia japonica]
MDTSTETPLYCNFTWIEMVNYQLQTRSDTYNHYYIIICIFCSISIVLNLHVILSFIFEKDLRKRHHIFIGSLALSDCLFSVTILISTAGGNLQPNTRKLLCTIAVAAAIISLQTLVAIAIERLFVIVLYPFDKDVNSPKRLFAGASMIWILSFTFTLLMNYFGNQKKLDNILGIWNLSILLVLHVVYFIIYKSVARHEKKMAPSRSHVEYVSKRLLKTFSIVSGSCAVCWLPIDILKLRIFDLSCKEEFYIDLYLFGFSLAVVYSVINPLVYGWRIKDLREATHRRMLRLCNMCRRG